jgi:hypothetical protein
VLRSDVVAISSMRLYGRQPSGQGSQAAYVGSAAYCLCIENVLGKCLFTDSLGLTSVVEASDSPGSMAPNCPSHSLVRWP